MDDRTQLWNDLAAQIAVDSIRCDDRRGLGHPDVVDVVRPPARGAVRRPPAQRRRGPRVPANDRFVMSKGHAAPALYATLKAIGAIYDEQLLSLRRLGSPIQGHPAPVPETALDRRRERLAGPGARGRARHGARDAAGRRARPRPGC